jgi:RNA polymerase sigma factor (sigma-70 family)
VRTDGELLARFAHTRDESAFSELVGRYGRLVRNVCRNVLRHEHDAEEATQATFLLLARRASSLRRPEALAGWLHGVAYRTALRARRAASRRRAYEARARSVPAASPPPGPTGEASWHELQAILDEELQRLPERLRSPFALCCLEGHGHGEAARLLGWKTSTVSSRLDEARRLLRRRLARRGVSLSAVLCGLTLADGGVRASLPAVLASQIVAAALRFARGGEAGSAENLAGAVLRREMWTRVVAVTLAASVACALVIGLGTSLRRREADTAGPQPTAAGPPAPAATAEADRPRLDRFGDPLPDGVIGRLGTKRFGHDWYTESAVWSPDGKIIASLGGLSSVRAICLWDAATGRESHQLAVKDAVPSAAFSPDGKTLATAEVSRGIVLWDVASGVEVGRFTGQGDGIAVAFAPDGRTLAAVGRGGVIQVREVTGGRLVVELNAGENSLVRRVAYAPDGQTLASAGSDGAVILWDLATGTARWRKKPHGGLAFGLAFSPDGKALASTGADAVIRVWDTASGESLISFGNAVKDGLLIAYSPDGQTLASPGPGDFVCLWDPSTGREKRRWHTGEQWLQSVSYSPDGRTLATTGFEGSRVRLWDPDTGRELRPAVGHNAPICGLSFSPDGKTVWSVGGDQVAIRWDVVSGEGQPLSAVRPVGQTLAFAVSHDGRTLATDGPDGSVCLWDADGHALGTLDGHAGTLHMVAFSPDGKVLASSGSDQTVRFWDVATHHELCRTEVLGSVWGCLAFSADGRKLALAGGGGAVAGSAPRVLDVQTGKEILRLEPPPPAPGVGVGWEEFVSFSPDGRTLVTIGNHQHQAARFWDVTTGKLVGHCGGDTHSHVWKSLAFSPDGRLLATGPYDRDDAVHLWEVATFQEVDRLRGHHGGVFALAFSPDGRSLASGGGDATVLVWDLTGRTGSGKRRTERLSPARLEECWEDLGGEDARAAYRAVRALAADPGRSVPFLAGRLRPTVPADPAGRDEWSRQRRAVMALEYAATPAARQLLQTLADAKAQSRLAGEARSALARSNGPP